MTSRHYLGMAKADRQTGAMPSTVQARPDALELWAAFRQHVGIGWTGQDERRFIAGWDAGRERRGEDT
jgi:hypothetical protein